jgi:hypothetical protein
MDNNETAIGVLTRCGPFSRLQAAELLDELQPQEVKELAGLAGNGTGDQFRALMDKISDRLHPPTVEEPVSDLDPGTVAPQ